MARGDRTQHFNIDPGKMLCVHVKWAKGGESRWYVKDYYYSSSVGGAILEGEEHCALEIPFKGVSTIMRHQVDANKGCYVGGIKTEHLRPSES